MSALITSSPPIRLKAGRFVSGRFVPDTEPAECSEQPTPTLTPELLIGALSQPSAPLELSRRVDDALVYAYTVNGEEVIRARPKMPRPGEPDLRICDGCGGSMEGKRRQAKYCATCLPTVKNTANVKRLRAREHRAALTEELAEHIERVRKMAGREGRQLSDRQALAIAEVRAASTEARAKDVLARYPATLYSDDDSDDDSSLVDPALIDFRTACLVEWAMLNDASGYRWPGNPSGSLGYVRRTMSRPAPFPRLRASQKPLETKDPCFDPDVSRQLQTGYASRPIDLDLRNR